MKIVSELSPIDQEQPEWFLLKKIEITNKSKRYSKNIEEYDRIYSSGSWIYVFKWNNEYLTLEELVIRLSSNFIPNHDYNYKTKTELGKILKNNIVHVAQTGLNPLKNNEFRSNITQNEIQGPVHELLSLNISLETFVTVEYPHQIKNPNFSLLDFIKYNTFLCVKSKKLLEKKDYSIFVVSRRDIKLGKGKFGAQVAHGIVSLLFKHSGTVYSESVFTDKYPKIQIFNASNVNILNEIELEARKLNINESLIVDAGHTQIESGTITVIAIGPGPTHYLERFLGYWDDLKKLE